MSQQNGRFAASSLFFHPMYRAALRFCGLALVFCLLSCSTDPPAASKSTIKIAYLPITHALPVLLQQQLAEADPAFGPRVELVRYGSWPELMDALNTGRVDGASVLGVLALKAREQGIDLTAALLAHRGGNVVIARPEIRTAADLKGRIVAIPHRQSSHNLLITQLLHDAGLSSADVRIVELSPAEMPAALSQDKIDAYCVAEPFGARAVVIGAGQVLAHDNELWPDAVCCTLVFNGAFVRNHADLARAYTQGYIKTATTITENKESVRELCRTALKAEGKTFELSTGWTRFSNLTLLPSDYDELVNRMKGAGLAETLPGFADFVDTRLAAPDPAPVTPATSAESRP